MTKSVLMTNPRMRSSSVGRGSIQTGQPKIGIIPSQNYKKPDSHSQRITNNVLLTKPGMRSNSR